MYSICQIVCLIYPLIHDRSDFGFYVTRELQPDTLLVHNPLGSCTAQGRNLIAIPSGSMIRYRMLKWNCVALHSFTRY
jgi:hypothetical protein